MKAIWRAGAFAGAAFAILSPVAARAGGSKTGADCGCTTPPPPCNCTVPTGHQINVPGVVISPPSVVVNSPSIWISGANVEVQGGSASNSSSSSSSSSSATATATSSGSAYGSASAYGAVSAAVNASAYGNGLAAANAAGYGYGGGGGFGGGTGGGVSYIPALQVESVETPEARRVCAEFRSVAKVVAVQAVCLDDKDVPHPASQVQPDRDVLPTYEGEVYRCIAGTHMQYTLADYGGQADFSRGQTISCLKGEALWHTAGGGLACRPQRPARDCNERSLLRRYGAGIKVLKMSMARQCVSYRSETAQGGPATVNGAMQLDGGVGGAY